MLEALKRPVTLSFRTEAQARAFRFACYNQRRGKDFLQNLSFKIVRNTLTIKVKVPDFEVL